MRFPEEIKSKSMIKIKSLALALALALALPSAFPQGLTLRDTAFVAALSGSHPPPVGGGVTITEPTLWWTMDETGSVDRTDQISSVVLVRGGASGSMPHGDGLYGNSASFTNIAGSLTTAFTTALAYTAGNNISISYWINFKSALLADAVPTFELSHNNSGGSIYYGRIQLTVNSGPTLYVSVDDDAPFYDYDDVQVTPFTFSQDQWYHWVTLYDGTSHLLSYYRDGSLVGTTDVGVTIPSGTHGRVLMSIGSGHTRAWIDELGIWMNHKLTTDEIDALNTTHPF